MKVNQGGVRVLDLTLSPATQWVLKDAATAHNGDPGFKASTLDLHASEELAEDVEKLSLKLVGEGLSTRFGVGIEKGIEDWLGNDVVELLKELTPDDLSLLEIQLMPFLLLDLEGVASVFKVRRVLWLCLIQIVCLSSILIQVIFF